MCAIPIQTGATYNENLGLFPVHPYLGYAGNPDLGGLIFNSTELYEPGAIMAVNIYGVDHDFVLSAPVFYVNGVQSCQAMVRCE
jgi:hypothetical protein